MARFEFKLDAQRIKKKQEEEKILKEKWAQYYAKDKINRKYQVDVEKHKIQLELMPNFYQLRPIDQRLQSRHRAYKLSPLSNTPAYKLARNEDTNIIFNNQFLSVRFYMALRKKILRDEIAKQKHQNKLDNAQRHRNEMLLKYW
ncbi:MAG: hypothetical protein P1U74_04945 [Legionellaceae bacterium]|nr:hypothetical protein [Legionellaceae bacterium]